MVFFYLVTTGWILTSAHLRIQFNSTQIQSRHKSDVDCSGNLVLLLFALSLKGKCRYVAVLCDCCVGKERGEREDR